MPVATDSYTSHATHSKQASLPVFPTDNVYDCVFDPSPELEAFLPWKTAQKREMIALTDGLTGVQYTYGQVASNSSFVAHNLTAKYGIQYGERVLICMPTSPEMLFIVLACQKVGIQMACCNDAFTPYELSHCVKTVKPVKMITLEGIAARLYEADDIEKEGFSKNVILAEPTSPLWDKVEEAPKRKVVDEQETCLLAFTSGTSGLPKVAMIPLEGFNKSLESVMVSSEMFMDTSQQLRLLLFLPIYHGSGLMQAIAGLMAGVHIVFCIKKPFDMMAILQTCAKYQIQVLGLVPAIANALLMCGPAATAALSHLRCIGVGAAPLSPELENKLRASFSQCTFVTAYGMTECVSPVTISTSNDPLRIPGSVGRVAPGCLIVLVDDEGKPVSEGQYGEILVKHVTMTKGYFENEPATRELIDEDGWMHTGDVGYLTANENLFVVDRKKDLIKYNALQISPAEIENVLSTHPLVREVGVIGVRDTRKVGEQVPRAYVALKEPTTADVEGELTALVAQSLSHYKHLRGGVRVVDALPRNGVGKLLRFKLREMADAEYVK